MHMFSPMCAHIANAHSAGLQKKEGTPMRKAIKEMVEAEEFAFGKSNEVVYVDIDRYELYWY